MNALRTGKWTKKVLAALMLCSLLFQIQAAFACPCCCDGMDANENTDEASDERPACCDIVAELTLKTVDADDEPALVSSPPSLDPPPVALVLWLITLWSEFVQASPSPVIRDLKDDPGHPGTQTYLSTLRLRI